MQLTSFTDYALRTLIYLASLPDNEQTNITDVTELFGVSRNHMVKVINRLGQLNYIQTVRGKNGGIRLNRPAKTILVGEVVRDLEPLDLVNCSVEFLPHHARMPFEGALISCEVGIFGGVG